MNNSNPIYIKAVKNNILSIAVNYMVPPLYISNIDTDKIKAVWSRYELLLKMLLECSTIESIINEVKEYDDFLEKNIGSHLWINYFDSNRVKELIVAVKEFVENEEQKQSYLTRIKNNVLGTLYKPFVKNPVLNQSVIPDYGYFNEAYNFCQKYGLNGLSFSLHEPYNENYFKDLSLLFEKFKAYTGYEKEQLGLNNSINIRLNNTRDFNISNNEDSKEYQSLGYFVADRSNSHITGDLTLMIQSLNDNEQILEVLIHEHTHAMDFYIGKQIPDVENNLFSSLDEKIISKYPKIKNEYRKLLFNAYNFDNREIPTEEDSMFIYSKVIENLISRMFSPFYSITSYEFMELKHNSLYLFKDISDRILGVVYDKNSYNNLKVLFNQPTAFIDDIVLKHLSEIKVIMFSSDMKLKCFYSSPTNHAERGFDSSPNHYGYFLSLEERLANAVALGILNNNPKIKESLKKIWNEVNNIVENKDCN